MTTPTAINTPEMAQPFGWLVGRLAASQTVRQGMLLMRDSAGNIRAGATAVGMVGIGRAEVDATSGTTAGVVNVRWKPGIFCYENLTTDPVDQASIGRLCFIVNARTVAKTNATNTRSRAGYVVAIDTRGVWVNFDEALTNAAN